MSTVRNIYKVLRGVLFTAAMVVIGLFVALYIILSVPAVQRAVKGEVESQVSELLGSKLTIGRLMVYPFNEARLQDVTLLTPDGEVCLTVGDLGAGVNLWKLLTTGQVEIVYAEIIGMDARIWQQAEGAPLNIQFIIDALQPRDKNKPPTEFDVRLHNVVIRKSRASFDKRWIPALDDAARFDSNHISVSDLRADVALPRLRRDDYTVDLRRLALNEKSGIDIESLSLMAHITPRQLDVADFQLNLAGSNINIGDFSLKYNGWADIIPSLRRQPHAFSLQAKPVVPSELAPFLPQLRAFDRPCLLMLDAHGTLSNVELQSLTLRQDDGALDLQVEGELGNLAHPSKLIADIRSLSLSASSEIVDKILVTAGVNDSGLSSKLRALGDVNLAAKGRMNLGDRQAKATAEISSALGDVIAGVEGSWNSPKQFGADFTVKSNGFDIGRLLADERFGTLAVEADGSARVSGGDIQGEVEALIPFADYNATRLNNIMVKASKQGDRVLADITADDELATLQANADCTLAGAASQWLVSANIDHFEPSRFGLLPQFSNSTLSGNLEAALSGNRVDNISGSASVTDLSFNSTQRSLNLENITVTADQEDGYRRYTIDSDVVNGYLSGDFNPVQTVAAIQDLLADVAPSMIARSKSKTAPDLGRGDFKLTVLPSDTFYGEMGIGVRPGVPVNIAGSFERATESVSLAIDAPYLIQGKNKLIKATTVVADLSAARGLEGDVKTTYPVKNDMANLHVKLSGLNDALRPRLMWTTEKSKTNRGDVPLELFLAKDAATGTPIIDMTIEKSGFTLHDSDWTVDSASVHYADNVVNVKGLRIWHADQFIDIHGNASKDPDDVLTADLAGIDLEYIFNTLNINYVNFGGIATGQAMVSGAFSGDPVVRTTHLSVRDLAYNNCVLGDAELRGSWDNTLKKIGIGADIRNSEGGGALVDGGVYLGGDSLDFTFDTDRINMAFLQPFMEAFTSSVQGKVTGRVRLYGTFSDLDLDGWAYADPVTMKVDYTNVYYHGTDTVRFTPGRIDVPRMTLYDKYGNTAQLRGWVTHRKLHDASFGFDITDARRLLGYDTDPAINPVWYGHVLASGSASIRGVPGLVNVGVNMNTDPGSKFTFVLDEKQTAVDYTFLTFSDRRKEERLAAEEVEVSFEDQYRKQATVATAEKPSIFNMDLAIGVNTGAECVIVMDPKAGDKISARGNGAFQMHYDSETDNFKLYGKYTLDRGTYNFSLQELILRNFKIEQGSSIAFNGDPLQGMLDITAAYRVNTSLTDLDRGFMSDPDLNRTNVPVDALLKVRGDMRSPDIKFDISLPTVTSDVERKVRSIISTEDMMNRQVIYLLALNRFYTPEFMGPGQGGELASVASSTLSSQISNIIGSMTDKFALSPSFKSDRSDFSDMEVDVALSSSLLNNRLLINGNFGYRDKSTSQTTFIGDFDIEYLLSKDGNLRLKAYNHFNDATYYLKSALTTQGVGLVWRKDFDDPFGWLKRLRLKRKKK